MKVRVLFFAALREQLGVSSEEVDLPGEAASVGALRAHLLRRGGAWQSALADGKLLRMAVNQVVAQPASPLRPGDEVAFFPPVTGG